MNSNRYPLPLLSSCLLSPYYITSLNLTLTEIHNYPEILYELNSYLFTSSRSWFRMRVICKRFKAWFYFRASEQSENWRLRHEGIDLN